MQLQDMEKQFIEEFFKGNYNPHLLFDEEIANQLLSHPVALRTQQQIIAEWQSQR